MHKNKAWHCNPSRDRRDRKFRDDTDIDTFWCPESRPILIPILRLSLHRDRYWYWYHENVPGLILIPIFYLIRILPRPSKKCSGLWIDTDTDTETPEIPGSRLILILAALVSVLSIRYWYSRLSLQARIRMCCIAMMQFAKCYLQRNANSLPVKLHHTEREPQW